jgi:hypothetical protein
MGYTLAMMQKHPKAKPLCVGIFSLKEDGRVWVQTKSSFIPYKATMVTLNGDVIMSNCEAFLKELERQSKLSQITYYYIEDEDRAAEYRDALIGS